MNVEQLPYDIIFDSNYADNGNPDNPRFVFKQPLNNVIGYSVVWVNMPFSYYTIDRMNNEFYYYDKASRPGETEILCQIRPGTYSATTFAQEMQRCIYQAGVTDGINLNAFIDPVTAKLTMYNRGLPLSEPWAIKIPEDNITLGSIMGFLPGVRYTAAWRQVFRDGEKVERLGVDAEDKMWTIVAEGQVNLTFSSVINVHSSLTAYGEVRTDPNEPDSKLIKVPLTSNFTSFINYSTFQPTIPCRRTEISNVEFYLRLPGRDVYGKDSKELEVEGEDDPFPNKPKFIPVQYLPLNGNGFQVCVRFIIDNAVRPVT